MKFAKIKYIPYKDEKPYVEGNYEFKLSDVVMYDPITFHGVKQISFLWDVEQSQDIAALQKDDELFKMLAEQLKQDFLKFLKEKHK